IVMQDGDLDAAVNAAINHRLATAGQRCTAAKRLFIHSAVYDDFRERLLSRVGALKVGDPMDPETFVGPVIHRRAAEAIQRSVQQAIDAGATLALGHRYEGAFVWPTVLENVPADCELMHEEVFGPVLPLYRF